MFCISGSSISSRRTPQMTPVTKRRAGLSLGALAKNCSKVVFFSTRVSMAFYV